MKKAAAPPKSAKTLAQMLVAEPFKAEEDPIHEAISDTEGISTRSAEVTEQIPASVVAARERRAGAPLSRAEEFETFKRDRGFAMNRNLTENKGKCSRSRVSLSQPILKKSERLPRTWQKA